MSWLRWAAAWALFWAGDLASRLVALLDRDDERVWPGFVTAFNAYQWCMTASHRVQGAGDRGPWESAPVNTGHPPDPDA